MEKDIIKQIILNQQEFISQVKLLPRKISIEENGNYVFVGIRRAGKTYMLYQHILQLLKDGHSKQEILFINFEDERITDIKKEELHLIVECYKEMFAFEPIIFLDEIQNVEGWEHFARRLADEKRRVFITGSNAHMLSREIASTLGGRYLMQEIYPFSFTEYLEYNHITLDTHWHLAPIRTDVVRLFEGYFYNGGLPESFSYTDKRAWLTSLYQKILYSDIVIRNNVRNEQSLRLLVRKLADSVLQPIAIKRLQNILQGDGRKHYFYDNGILNLFLFQPETKLLENIVAIHLYKQYGEALFYYNKNVEVDFVVPDAGLAIQVSYSLRDEQTRNREVNALVSLSRFMNISTALIISKDQEETIEQDGVNIKMIPVWKWLAE